MRAAYVAALFAGHACGARAAPPTARGPDPAAACDWVGRLVVTVTPSSPTSCVAGREVDVALAVNPSSLSAGSAPEPTFVGQAPGMRVQVWGSRDPCAVDLVLPPTEADGSYIRAEVEQEPATGRITGTAIGSLPCTAPECSACEAELTVDGGITRE